MRILSNAIIITIITLILMEISFRIAFPIPEVTNFDRINYSVTQIFDGRTYATGHSVFEVQSTPDATKTFTYELNIYGFRDDEWQIKKEPGTRRIAFVGDSFAEGLMTERENNIPSTFRDIVRQQSKTRIETMNWGSSGTGLPEYLKVVIDGGLIFKPDDLIVILFANDMLPPALDPQRLVPIVPEYAKPDIRVLTIFRKLLHKQPLMTRWHRKPFNLFPAVPNPLNPWSKHRTAVRFSKFVRPDIAKAMQEGKFNPFYAGTDDEKALSEQISPYVEEYIKQMKITADINKARIYFVYIPLPAQVSDRYLPYKLAYSYSDQTSLLDEKYQQSTRLVSKICAEYGIPFLDMTELLRKKEMDDKENLYWFYDGHLNAKGYQFAGNEIVKFWMKESQF
jgi:lysophospholipase L1-like esterase